MDHFNPPGGVAIGRVKARLVGIGETAVRLRLGRLLGTASLQPPAMPPSAVLIVRKLADPLPGRVAAGPDALKVAADWEAATRIALADLYRRAARPFHEPGALDPEAVRFADEGEMLACLLRDLSLGPDVAGTRWWWRTFLRALPSRPGDTVAALLGRSPKLIPAVLVHLRTLGRSETVVALISPVQAMNVLNAVAAVHGVVDFPSSLRKPARRERAAPGPDRVTGRPPEDEPVKTTAMPVPRWPTGRASSGGLSLEHRLLIGVGLRLSEDPSSLRDAAFVDSVRDWWQAETNARPAPTDRFRPSSGGRTPIVPRRADPASPHAEDMTDTGPIPGEPGVRVGSKEQAATRTGGLGSSGAEPESSGDREIDGPSHVRVRQEQPRAAEAVAARDEPAEGVGEAGQPGGMCVEDVENDLGIADETETQRRWEGGVETALGGILYLINMMTRLDLPGCFESSWDLASAVGAWGVLDLLGRGLLTAECPEVAAISDDDALWEALARLDGRTPGEPPGQRCPEGRDFRLPPWWQASSLEETDGPHFWSVSHGRLRLWTSTGSLVVECRRNDTPARSQARVEMEPYRSSGGHRQGDREPRHARYDEAPIERIRGPLVDGLTRPASRWLTRVLPWVRLRLRRALGGEIPGEELLRRSGRLFVTSTHLDMVMPLDDIWLPARRAGLDRNPGWVADLGRVVLFHFESWESGRGD